MLRNLPLWLKKSTGGRGRVEYASEHRTVRSRGGVIVFMASTRYQLPILDTVPVGHPETHHRIRQNHSYEAGC